MLLHGAGQTRHAWKTAGHDLAAHGYRVIALDARGHGDSDWAADKDYSSLTMIKDVVQFVVIYAILVLAFSMLFLGVGDPQVHWGYCCMCVFGNVGERT